MTVLKPGTLRSSENVIWVLSLIVLVLMGLYWFDHLDEKAAEKEAQTQAQTLEPTLDFPPLVVPRPTATPTLNTSVVLDDYRYALVVFRDKHMGILIDREGQAWLCETYDGTLGATGSVVLGETKPLCSMDPEPLVIGQK